VLRTAILLSAMVAACGARTELPAPDVEGAGGAGGSTATTSGGHECLETCTIGHGCCLGSCDGPNVAEGPCCQCLPSEVNSLLCGGECGGD
jgi:hypothetical protein